MKILWTKSSWKKNKRIKTEDVNDHNEKFLKHILSYFLKIEYLLSRILSHIHLLFCY